ncbi:MAG: hypothetical protein GX431_12220 [Bacteroidales bacterium]|jgi:hypothetical protein|nr:hypothetical protein [Bacteroidales bacterium]
MQIAVIPYSVIDRTELPSVWVDKVPESGEVLDINSRRFYVCGTESPGREGPPVVKVVPCVVSCTSRGWSFGSYIESLAAALSRMKYL